MTNGNYYYIKTPSEFMSSISLWSARGSSQDPKGKEGLSHYFEHLFLNKTESLPNKIAVLRKIDSLGIFFNAYTKKNSVHYYFIQQVEAQEKAYKILLQSLKEFNVDEDDITREREIILNEQNQFIANPKIYLWNLADQGLWPNLPLSDSSLGTKTSISSITKDDILGYKELLFAPQNIGFLTISSLKDSRSLEKELIELTQTDTSSIKPRAYATGGKSNKIMCEYRAIGTVFIAFSFPLPGLDDFIQDKITIEFIRNYLVSGWSSRLIERLRSEKNYAYWAFGGIESFYEAGYFRISLSTTKNHISEIVKIITEEIEKIQHDEMNEEQMLHHKNTMKAHFLKHYTEIENSLLWYGWNLFIAHRNITLSDYINSLNAIKSSEVQSCARKYLSIRNLHIAALGNISESELRFALLKR